LLRIAPEIISVLDYARGFGTTHLVTFSELDLDVHIDQRHRWGRQYLVADATMPSLEPALKRFASDAWIAESA
jgi:hypothetical protein